METIPLAQLYRWNDNICQNHMEWSEVLLGMFYRNTLRTWWEHCGNRKKLKKKNPDATLVHVVHTHWLHVTFIFKMIGHHFQPWLIPLQKTVVSKKTYPPQGGPFTPWGAFSLVAWKFYSSNWLPKNTLPIWFHFWLWPLYLWWDQ